MTAATGEQPIRAGRCLGVVGPITPGRAGARLRRPTWPGARPARRQAVSSIERRPAAYVLARGHPTEGRMPDLDAADLAATGDRV